MTPVKLLVVCTANICRSPVVAAAIRRGIERTGVVAAVGSAGTIGGRLEIHRDTIRAAGEAGLDVADHRSRALTTELIRDEGADLVLALERSHVRDIVGLAPDAWRRTFTLKEFVRRSDAAAAQHGDLETWISSLSEGRRTADYMRASDVDDVHDPYGSPLSAHRAMVAEVVELSERVSGALSGGS